LDKKKFLNIFEGEDKNLLAMVYEEIQLCKKINYQVYTDIFLPPQIWSRLEEMEKSLGAEVYTLGLNDASEKRVCLFNPVGEEIYSYDYPVVFFTITGGNKFRELEHRHFLAAIMGLGIKREKLGDLVVREGKCYGVIAEELFDFLTVNLSQVGKVEVEVEKTTRESVPESRFEETILLVSSLRLDNLVSAVTGLSRSASTELIEEGIVTVNYGIKRRRDMQIEPGDVVSIRRYGKYRFSQIVGESKKGKARIMLKKYV